MDHVELLESFFTLGKRALFILTFGTMILSSFSGAIAQVELIDGIVIGVAHQIVSW
jgi:hypothetical protein